MDPTELNRLVEGWIALQKTEHDSEAYHALFWSFEEVWNLVGGKPQEAFDFILAVLARDSSGEIMGVLAAGPLEDLLNGHGSVVIDQIEAEARRNPLFASLLGGVWKNTIDDPVWKRVVAVRNVTGWD